MTTQTQTRDVFSTLYRMARQIGDARVLVSVRELAAGLNLAVPLVEACLAELTAAGDVLRIGYGGMTYRLTVQGEARALREFPAATPEGAPAASPRS